MTPAVDTLVNLGLPHKVLTYDHDPAAVSFGAEAAEALGVAPDTVFKTLLASVESSTGRELVVGIVPVTTMLNLKALAKAVGAKKAQLADPAAAERATGYVVGGISPVGQKQQLTTVLDESAFVHDLIRCSGGKRGMELELSPADLAGAVGAVVTDIAVW